MNYIDERDLLNEDSHVCEYTITHILNDLIMEINELKEQLNNRDNEQNITESSKQRTN